VRYRINDQVVLLRMPEKGPEGPFCAYLGAFADSLSLQRPDGHFDFLHPWPGQLPPVDYCWVM
jgi:hypothetical protein